MSRLTKAQVRLGYKSTIHQFGTKFPKPPTVQEALDKIGGNFEVEKVQAQYQGRDVPGHFWTVRKDTNIVLGGVGSKYQTIQQSAFSLLNDIGGDVIIDTASVLGRGEKTFMACKLRKPPRSQAT